VRCLADDADDGNTGEAASLSGELLEDLRMLLLLATEAGQAAQALRDENLLATVRACHEQTELRSSGSRPGSRKPRPRRCS
jgi:hypothetical protein